MDTSSEIIIHPHVRTLVETFCREILLQLGNPATDLQVNVDSVLDIKQRQHLLWQVERTFQDDLRKLDILEVGAGVGLFTIMARLLGLSIVGAEPAANSYSTSAAARHQLLADNQLPADTIVEAGGEELPFEDQQFDLALSFNVLEHVRDPQQVMQETYRVLRPGGKVYFRMPNYSTFYEGHYGIFWLPWLNKQNARRYVEMWGRNPEFLNELYFVRPNLVRRAAEKAGFKVHAIFDGQVKLQTPANPVIANTVIAKSNTARAAWLFRQLWAVGQTSAMRQLLSALQIYPVITLIAQK